MSSRATRPPARAELEAFTSAKLRVRPWNQVSEESGWRLARQRRTSATVLTPGNVSGAAVLVNDRVSYRSVRHVDQCQSLCGRGAGRQSSILGLEHVLQPARSTAVGADLVQRAGDASDQATEEP